MGMALRDGLGFLQAAGHLPVHHIPARPQEPTVGVSAVCAAAIQVIVVCARRQGRGQREGSCRRGGAVHRLPHSDAVARRQRACATAVDDRDGRGAAGLPAVDDQAV
ncbi:hypothetical protein G6F40_015531 [Rhizopus arrhizus]|nr:hypothetical protein G6F40_015531 [Rhizopus arrhizus]